MARKISSKSLYTLMVAKQSINLADETTLHSGSKMERFLISSLMSTEASKEGVDAFVNKRKPDFKKIWIKK